MDVLEFWEPQLDWSRFTQGALTDPMWRYFCQMVQLSHARQHWQDVRREIQLRPPGPSPFGKESKYQRNKRRDEWQSEIRRAERHMHRAGHLGAEKIAEMSNLLSPSDEGTPGWNLYWALRLAVQHQRHETGRFKAAAFTEFNADDELKDEPLEIAARWLRQAGYSTTGELAAE